MVEDDDQFVVTYPAYVIVGDYVDTGNGTFQASGPLSIQIEECDCIAIFTDDDSARRFVRINQIVPNGMHMIASETPAQLAGNLERIRASGSRSTHVAFDPGSRGGAVTFRELGVFIAQLRGML